MKTRTINVYSFQELSDEAQEHAIDHFRNSDEGYFWGDECIKSIEGFLKHFGGRVTNYSIDWYCSSHFSSVMKCDQLTQVSNWLFVPTFSFRALIISAAASSMAAFWFEWFSLVINCHSA